MTYDVIADKVALGAAQGSAGGVMGMALGGFNALAQGVADEQAMKDQYFQQLKLNNMSQRFNKDMYNYQMDKQYEFWQKTNYAAQVEQLKKAGLNPALLYGKGGGMGATTGNASAGNMQSHAGSDTDRMGLAVARQGQAMEMSLLSSQIANINADTELKKANAEKTAGADTENVKSQTNVNNANIKNIEENTRNTFLKSEGQLVTNELLKLQKQYEEGTLDDRILNQKLQNDQLDASIRKLNEEIPWIGKIAEATVNDLKQKVATGKAQQRLLFQQGSAQVFENTKEQRDLRTQEKKSRIAIAEQQAMTQSLQNKYFKEYGITPGSGMANLISTIIAKFVDDNGNKLLSGEKEVLRELEQLLKDAQKESKDVLNKYQTGKFWWE